MKKYKLAIILINLILLLFIFNCSILKKETLIEEGQLVLLELAPVDPRSLMQGDFMWLNYAITLNVPRHEEISKRGYCVVRLDSVGVAQRVRLQDHISPKNAGEFIIEYTKRDWQGINIGAESFFFQEGDGPMYEKAEYGGLKVDENGGSVLIGLYDKNRIKIE